MYRQRCGGSSPFDGTKIFSQRKGVPACGPGSLANFPKPPREVKCCHEKTAGLVLLEERPTIRTVSAACRDVCGAEGGDHDGRSAGQRNAAAGSDAGGDYEKCAGDFEEAARASGVWICECEEAGRECRCRGGAEIMGGSGAGGESYLRAHGFGAQHGGGVPGGDG